MLCAKKGRTGVESVQLSWHFQPAFHFILYDQPFHMYILIYCKTRRFHSRSPTMLSIHLVILLTMFVWEVLPDCL